jgi:hypothetical protein
MSEQQPINANDPPLAKQPNDNDPFKGKDYLTDPMTGERIYSPEAVKRIEAELDRREQRRKPADSGESQP